MRPDQNVDLSNYYGGSDDVLVLSSPDHDTAAITSLMLQRTTRVNEAIFGCSATEYVAFCNKSTGLFDVVSLHYASQRKPFTADVCIISPHDFNHENHFQFSRLHKQGLSREEALEEISFYNDILRREAAGLKAGPAPNPT